MVAKIAVLKYAADVKEKRQYHLFDDEIAYSQPRQSFNKKKQKAPKADSFKPLQELLLFGR